MSSVNSPEPSNEAIFESDNNVPVSVSIRGKHIAIGAEDIYLGSIDGTQIKKSPKSLSGHNQVCTLILFNLVVYLLLVFRTWAHLS